MPMEHRLPLGCCWSIAEFSGTVVTKGGAGRRVSTKAPVAAVGVGGGVCYLGRLESDDGNVNCNNAVSQQDTSAGSRFEARRSTCICASIESRSRRWFLKSGGLLVRRTKRPVSVAEGFCSKQRAIRAGGW